MRPIVSLVRELIRWMAGARREPGNGPRPLERDDTLSFRPTPGGLDIRSLLGTLLVTQERDPEDHVLAPGAAFRAAGRGVVVVWALSDASVAVAPVRSGRIARARR